MEPPAGELPPPQAPQKGWPALGLDSSAHGLHGSRWSACCRGRHTGLWPTQLLSPSTGDGLAGDRATTQSG